jgi:hypothetical protein
MLLRYLKGTKLLSYRGYVLVLVMSWLYTFFWAAGLLTTWFYWERLGLYSKFGICVALIVMTPVGGELIQTYQKYKEQWELSNK